MKFALSVAVLALSASQVMGYAATPIKGCTKTVVVQATDLSCVDFATANGVTFDDLLKWNTRLSKVCDNLDVGFPICVSVTPGAASTGAPSSGSTSAGPTSAGPTSAGPTATVPSGPAASGTAASTKSSAPSATSAAAGSTTTAPAVPKPSNSASGSKASVAIAAAGVLLSVAYML